MAPLTNQELAALALVRAMGDVIRAAGDEGVPSGNMYAHLCGKMTLEQFDAIVNTLIRAKMVEKKNHVLRWIGPKETQDDQL